MLCARLGGAMAAVGRAIGQCYVLWCAQQSMGWGWGYLSAARCYIRYIIEIVHVCYVNTVCHPTCTICVCSSLLTHNNAWSWVFVDRHGVQFYRRAIDAPWCYLVALISGSSLTKIGDVLDEGRFMANSGRKRAPHQPGAEA
jgi:hypothetical protein